MDERPVTEAELQAWLDGELHAERCAAVRRHLAEHAEDARRLESYRRHSALIARAFAAPTDIAQPLPASRRLRPLLAAGLAALLLLGGAAAGWFGRDLAPTKTADLADYALAAHRLYAAEARHAVEVSAEESDHLVAWLSKRLDHPLRIPSLEASGYRFVGGRLLPSEYGPAAQLMYEDAEGRRITIYLCAAELRAGEAVRTARSGKATALLWRGDGLVWAMVGEIDRDGLEQLAHQVQSELAS